MIVLYEMNGTYIPYTDHPRTFLSAYAHHNTIDANKSFLTNIYISTTTNKPVKTKPSKNIAPSILALQPEMPCIVYVSYA